MSRNNPRAGDFGFSIVLTLVDDAGEGIDISAADTIQYIIRDPDGTITNKTAAFVNTGTDGKLTWTATDGFFDTVGTYEIEARALDTGVYEKRSEAFKVSVSSAFTLP